MEPQHILRQPFLTRKFAYKRTNLYSDLTTSALIHELLLRLQTSCVPFPMYTNLESFDFLEIPIRQRPLRTRT